MSRRGSSRNACTATALVVVLVLGLVAVLLGLVGSGGPDAVPAAASPSPRPATTAASAARPTATRRASPTPTRTTTTTGRDAETGLRLVAASSLPREAQATLALIDAGGPFPYGQDGVTFGNYERVLPTHPRGWYREYTVETPGERDRGPRRIVTGDRDQQIFYTPDHYASFVRVTR